MRTCNRSSSSGNRLGKLPSGGRPLPSLGLLGETGEGMGADGLVETIYTDLQKGNTSTARAFISDLVGTLVDSVIVNKLVDALAERSLAKGGASSSGDRHADTSGSLVLSGKCPSLSSFHGCPPSYRRCPQNRGRLNPPCAPRASRLPDPEARVAHELPERDTGIDLARLQMVVRSADPGPDRSSHPDRSSGAPTIPARPARRSTGGTSGSRRSGARADRWGLAGAGGAHWRGRQLVAHLSGQTRRPTPTRQARAAHSRGSQWTSRA
jgi:hypothetical protein